MNCANSRQAGKAWHVVVSVLAVLVLALVLGPRNAYGPDEPAPRAAPPADLQQLDAWLVQQEAVFSDIRPGVAKGIVWHQGVGQRTPWAVVYVHGFTASRMEVAPLPEQVAQALGANVFYTRLAGNGRTSQAMGEATVQDWLADTVEAVRIGRQLGDKVLLMGTSTGGTLGTWLGMRPQPEGADAYVFISPNYGPKKRESELINLPWGQQLAFLLEGEERGEVSGNPLEAIGWTERYATRALFPMMALVKHVRDESRPADFRAPVLVFYAEGDQTVEPALTREVFERLGSTHKTLEKVDYSQAKGQHVLAGDVRDAQATPVMSARIVQWVRELP